MNLGPDNITVLVITPLEVGYYTPHHEQHVIQVVVGTELVGTVQAMTISHFDARADDVTGVPDSMQAVLRRVLHPDGGVTELVAETVKDVDAWGLVIGDVDVDCSVSTWQQVLVRIVQGLRHGCGWVAIHAQHIGSGPPGTAPGIYADYVALGFLELGEGVLILPLSTRELDRALALAHGAQDGAALTELPARTSEPPLFSGLDGDESVGANLTVAPEDFVINLNLNLGSRLYLVEALASAGRIAGSVGAENGIQHLRELQEYARELIWLVAVETPDVMVARRVQALLRTIETEVASRRPVSSDLPVTWQDVVDLIDDVLTPPEDEGPD